MFDLANFVNELSTGKFDIYDDIKAKKMLYQSIIYGTLTNIIGNVFDYEGMSENQEIDLKRCYMYSHYVGYSNSIDNFIPLAPRGKANVYQEYTEFESMIGDIKEKFNVTDSENVVGFNRTFYTVSDNYVCYTYACKIAELLISIDNSIVASRILNIIVGDENQLKELQLLWDKLNIGMPVHITQKFDKDKVDCIHLQEPVKISEYYDAYREILNEFMTVTGLNSLMQPSKKERLLTDEIQINSDIKSTILYDKYQNRVKFMENINKKFGTNFSVKFNVNIDNIAALGRTESEDDDNV